jgi:farnesyl-diphosphate farnesyltransferase
LSAATKRDERELVAHTARVVGVTHGFPAFQRDALVRCIRIMSAGMADFQCSRGERSGLADQKSMDRYCYCVAGVVGETLTELFCQHSEAIAANKARLLELSVSFGQGLQMTNILKDVWDDRVRGFCWLPREVFGRHGFDLDTMDRGDRTEAFAGALQELIALAHGHLRNALAYTLLIPSHESGIRRFCLWALGMAVLTLRKVHRLRARFATGREVKISRRTVRATVLVSNLSSRRDALLRMLFRLCSVGLPIAEPSHATH